MNKENAKKPVRLLIVDDHPVVRAGLSSMLGKQKDVDLVGVAASAEEAMAILGRRPVDIVLLDLRMPKVNGIDAIGLFHKHPATQIIILSSFALEEEVFRAVQAGARGYLLKEMSRDEIVSAILAVHAGKQYFPPAIASALAERNHRSSLSRRELEILELLCKGLTNKEIAQAFGISKFTVRNHVNNITQKLDVSDRTEAASIAIKQGIVQVTS